jgi:hemoglobin
MNADVRASLFEQLGGEKTLRELTERFYGFMDTLDEAQEIRAMHAADLSEAKQKLFEFLCGWSGGPQYYQEKYGHPRLRMRHMPFEIGESERDQWMLCMTKALDEVDISPQLRVKLRDNFAQIADFMRNK